MGWKLQHQLAICQRIEKRMDIGKAVSVDVLSEDVSNAVLRGKVVCLSVQHWLLWWLVLLLLRKVLLQLENYHDMFSQGE